MNNRTRERIINVCSILAEQENLKVAITESGKGALLAGMGVFIGGLLGGPIGMAIGGTVSSVAVACSSRGKFKSVIEIINDMNENQKTRLGKAVMAVLEDIRPTDVMWTLSMALTDTSIKEVIIKELGSFLLRELQLQMIK